MIFSALFLPREQIDSEEDAELLAEEWSEDLESMKCFVLEGKKFVHLPEEEKGQFYSQNSYVFVCRYLYGPELGEDEELDEDDDQVNIQAIFVSKFSIFRYKFFLNFLFNLFRKMKRR